MFNISWNKVLKTLIALKLFKNNMYQTTQMDVASFKYTEVLFSLTLIAPDI